MGNEGENIDTSSSCSAVIDSDLRVWYTSAKARFNIWLVLLESHAASRSYEVDDDDVLI